MPPADGDRHSWCDQSRDRLRATPVTIVQRCPAKACEGHVRYKRVRRGFDNYLVGRCDECDRTYRLYNGHPAVSDRGPRLRALGTMWAGVLRRTA